MQLSEIVFVFALKLIKTELNPAYESEVWLC